MATILILAPALVVTTRDPLANKRRAEAGGEMFFQEPVENDEFLAAVEKAVSQKGDASRITSK